ncbi:Gfo/Idh/MocA family protein [Streptomyces griseiscabiei]|uniref:Glycosyl hydrolase family 109 protein n=1 Tax=Streptomyces griseiscabiei TaxID=2993540 RepID=A0ABU4LHK4_9ACTN|nr:Gfo/Idh/MocA family oxidoreductase [Streptomyces griseiscabiei]MBZ3907945.1 Gfo/Idh/MocA family oxidoreductase [Streptomyces griseiscabiei]MDX2915093.1 Gfo/Idh/MocA family oxidoreductase [Streptomyces griseiscabiei]
MSDALRIGVLGCAAIARRRVLPAIAAAGGAALTAVAGRDAARARETAAPYGARPVRGYQELLDRDDVDAVYVPLPAALHEKWTEAALRAGKHVLAEKPLTTDPAATGRLLALARSSGLFLMENVMFVHHGQHEAVRRLLADGAIGELRGLSAAFAVPRLADDDIRYRADLGGGALWDTGVYPVRAAMHLLGDALTVRGAVLTDGPGREVDTAGTALLSTPEGVAVQLSFGLDHAYRSRYELWGSEGSLTVDRVFTPPADHRPEVRLRRGAEARTLRLPAQDQVLATVEAFVRGVRAGAAPDGTLLRQAELLLAIRRAAGR